MRKRLSLGPRWERWYAWYPVDVISDGVAYSVWLETVERCWDVPEGYPGECGGYDYRFCNKD